MGVITVLFYALVLFTVDNTSSILIALLLSKYSLKDVWSLAPKYKTLYFSQVPLSLLLALGVDYMLVVIIHLLVTFVTTYIIVYNLDEDTSYEKVSEKMFNITALWIFIVFMTQLIVLIITGLFGVEYVYNVYSDMTTVFKLNNLTAFYLGYSMNMYVRAVFIVIIALSKLCNRGGYSDECD